MENQPAPRSDKLVHSVEIAHGLANIEAPYREIAAIALRYPALPEMLEIARTSQLAGRRTVATMAKMEVVPGFEKRPNAQLVGKVAETAQRSLQNEQWAHFARERTPGEALHLDSVDDVNPALLGVVGQVVNELQDTDENFAYERAWGRGLKNMPFANLLRVTGFEGDLRDITLTHLPVDQDYFHESLPNPDRNWPNTKANARIALSATMLTEAEQPMGQRVVEAYIYQLDFKNAGKRTFYPRVNATVGKTASVVDATEKLAEYNANRSS